MKKASLLITFLFLSALVSAQSAGGLNYLLDNYSIMNPARSYNQMAGQQYNTPDYYNHPDFGKLTFDAPYNKEVVEVLSKRTADERYYVDLTDPAFFYIQKSAKPINYFHLGQWLAIDPSISLHAPGVYKALRQPNPTGLNFNTTSTWLENGSSQLSFNNYKLTVVNGAGISTVYQANWANYQVGNFGVYFTNIFPNIDMKIMFNEGSVKSDFIIKASFAGNKKLIFTDNTSGSGLSYFQSTGLLGEYFIGDILVTNSSNLPAFTIKKADSYDQSGSKQRWYNAYKINGNAIDLLIDSAQINTPGIVYPLILDPLVTVAGPVAGAGILGSLLSPAVCSQNLTVSYPGGTTPWDFSASWVVQTNFCCSSFIDCWMSEAQVRINSSCGGQTPVAPSVWVCLGCNNFGNWNPTLPFSSSGCQSMMQCYTPSCLAQNMVFTFNLNRTYCANTSGCNCSWATNDCSYLNSWNVTLQGRSMEVLGNTAGNGSTTQAATCYGSVTMNPNPQYGITPLSFLWSPGGQITPTHTFSPTSPGNNVFTCNVTDACGTVRVATFTITNNCVLPIELKDYTASYNGNHTNIKWTTASEKNAEYFTVERSINGSDYVLLEKIPAAINSTSQKNYSSKDFSPNKKGVNYYRLKQFDVGGNEKFSKVITVDIFEEVLEVKLIPNPASTDLDIELSDNFIGKTVNIELHDIMGKKHILKQNIHIHSETRTTHLNLTALPKGMYFVNVITEDFTIYKNKLIKL
ncbi:MAG: T9SS type A sorting domain-containing protein [Bacteroidetes bacterium]|nr:T9SS type A sorting domain-containing protein [Bacteroidota bacterium]